MFKIVSWNVNSLKVRLPQVLTWLKEQQPDIVALQELKIPEADFPRSAFTELGYQAIINGQRTYNGVALLGREPWRHVVNGFPDLVDEQRRVIAGSHGLLRVVNLYVPNGESIVSNKYQYKLTWLKHCINFLRTELERYPYMVVVGDFNIAPTDQDIYDPVAWRDHVLASEPERAAFADLLRVGFIDCFRALQPNLQAFSWWDYRQFSFKRGRGLRIDHVLANNILFKQCCSCYIDKLPRALEKPSDHAPVVAEFKNEFT